MDIPPTLSPLPFVPCPKVDSAVRDAHGHLVAYFYGEHGHMNRELFLVLVNGAEAAIEAVRSNIEDQEGTIETLNDELAESEKSFDRLNEEARGYLSAIDRLSEQNDDLRSEIEEFKRRLSVLEGPTY